MMRRLTPRFLENSLLAPWRLGVRSFRGLA